MEKIVFIQENGEEIIPVHRPKGVWHIIKHRGNGIALLCQFQQLSRKTEIFPWSGERQKAAHLCENCIRILKRAAKREKVHLFRNGIPDSFVKAYRILMEPDERTCSRLDGMGIEAIPKEPGWILVKQKDLEDLLLRSRR